MGVVRELFAGNALKKPARREAMNRNFDPLENPGDLLHAVLEGLIVAEISDVTAATKQFELLTSHGEFRESKASEKAAFQIPDASDPPGRITS